MGSIVRTPLAARYQISLHIPGIVNIFVVCLAFYDETTKTDCQTKYFGHYLI